MDYREGMDILREARVFAPALVQFEGSYMVFSRTKLISRGSSIGEALRAGGFLPRPEHLPIAKFTAKDLVVNYKGVPVATTLSKNMAVRIANALNEYVPGDRAK